MPIAWSIIETKAKQTQEMYFLDHGREQVFWLMYIMPTSTFVLMLINYQNFTISFSFREKEDEKLNRDRIKLI